MRSFSEKFIFTLFIVCLFLGLYRIWGYTIYEVPYGYDPGFFRYAIEGAIRVLPALPVGSEPFLPYHEPLFPILAVILTFIGFTPDTIIGPFLGFLSVFTAFCVYFLAKQSHNRIVGYIAASIFLLSIVQYQEYWWNYWRNIVGGILLLTTLALAVKKSPLLLLTLAGTLTIHRASGLYLIIVLGILCIVECLKEKKITWKLIGYICAGGLIALPLYARELSVITDMLTPLTTTFGSSSMSGTFFTSEEFFFLVLPYLIIVLPALYKKIDTQQYDALCIGFLVGLVWSIFRLFFYNRMFVFFDIFLILMAAYALSMILATTHKWLAYGSVSIFFLVQGYLYTTHATNYISRHSISREEFDIIENLDILIPTDSTILSTHRFYTPWLLGYSKMRTLAPGLLADQIWDESRWNEFYFHTDGATKCTMIQDYKAVTPKLYIFVGDQQPPLDLPSPCFRPLLSNTTHPIVYEVIWK